MRAPFIFIITVYKLFENLKSKIDLNELDAILVDFKQMGLDYELKFDPDIIINWDKVDAANGLYYLSKYDLDIKDNIGRLAWSKGIASNSCKNRILSKSILKW